MSRTHVFIIDGTLSRIKDGEETNAGLLYKLLRVQPDLKVGYDRGVQGRGWLKWLNVLTGNGINCSIRGGYTALAKAYQPGDKIFLFGFSRGAYAVRSIAGMIAKVGLLTPQNVSNKRIRNAFHLYENCVDGKRSGEFRKKLCHETIEIEMIGVWDTVKSLGLPFPVLSYISPMATEFHDHKLSKIINNAFQALAADENRHAFEPIQWKYRPDWHGRLEQAWFAGAHSDIGGHVLALPEARALSNISLHWMLDRAAMCGLLLPRNWAARFPTDPLAEMQGPYAGISKYFLIRGARKFGGEQYKVAQYEAAQYGGKQANYLHESLITRMNSLPTYKPRLAGYPAIRQTPPSLREAPSG
ncbi:MAG: DUF2235 domain-containing protein [Rhodobacteraceae bacterium]|nr:DUF2235 domain-containing protein [Paracoccaceae bacterium]